MFYGTIWALLPPVVAIALALITKEVYSSLFLGIVVGAALVAAVLFSIRARKKRGGGCGCGCSGCSGCPSTSDKNKK